MRKIALVVLAASAVVLTNGCGEKSYEKGKASASKEGPDFKGGAGSAGTGVDMGAEDRAEMKMREKSPAAKRSREEAIKKPEAAAAEPMVGVGKARQGPTSPPVKAPQSGLLTAGSFDDNVNPPFFRSLAGKLGQHPSFGDLPGKLLGRHLVIVVKNGEGQPVGNARVQIAPAGGGSDVQLISRSDGRVIFLSSWDQVAADGDFLVTVTPPDGKSEVKQKVPRDAGRWEVTLPALAAPLPANLDLTIVLDTTGSMGDELEFLKSEIKSIFGTIHERFPQVNQRYALILYRDDGDEYVTRPFDFTRSIDEFRKNLSAQSATGGGDYPEAMHRGLQEATQLRWREGNTARVLFLIADAPPHAQFMGQTLAAANKLRKQGVAIYPVACSGYDDACEFVMRTCAMLTGSQFLFLTDDSGVGEGHGEPHIPFYHVEKLDKLMVRMITSELSGKRLGVPMGDIIRTVGKPIN
jgi:hypothetical protein